MAGLPPQIIAQNRDDLIAGGLAAGAIIRPRKQRPYLDCHKGMTYAQNKIWTCLQKELFLKRYRRWEVLLKPRSYSLLKIQFIFVKNTIVDLVF